jgi:hypothetical protein
MSIYSFLKFDKYQRNIKTDVPTPNDQIDIQRMPPIFINTPWITVK